MTLFWLLVDCGRGLGVWGLSVLCFSRRRGRSRWTEWVLGGGESSAGGNEGLLNEPGSEQEYGLPCKE